MRGPAGTSNPGARQVAKVTIDTIGQQSAAPSVLSASRAVGKSARYTPGGIFL